MSKLVTIVGLIVFTVLWRQIVPRRFRDKCLPWAIAVAIMNVSSASFYWGPLRAVYGLSNYISFAIMLDGLGGRIKMDNPVWKAFLFFEGYMILASLFGEYIFQGILFWIHTFLITFCTGYFSARWAIRTPCAMQRISFAITIVCLITMFLYFKHGGLSVVEETGLGRGGFDMETLGQDVKSNVNYTALCMVCFIPFLVVAVLRKAFGTFDKLTKLLSILGLILVLLELVRTGARNGVLALLPVVWYFVFATTNHIKRKRRIALFVGISIVFLPLMFFMMKGADSIRVFSMKAEAAEKGENTIDAYSSGRITMWMNLIDNMDFMKRVHGAGLARWAKDPFTGAVTPGNAHSMYMTVFYQSGYLGCFLLLVVFMMALGYSFMRKERFRMGGMFFCTWMLSGLGESWGIIGGMTALLAGFGMGLMTKEVARNPEFGELVIWQ